MMTTQETREQIVTLCRKAGLAPLRVTEIEQGCDADRVQQIIYRQIGDCQPGTLVLSDPDAAWQALGLAWRLQFAEQDGR